MTAMKDKEFVKITNRDIYDEIKKNHEDNISSHQAIIVRLDRTNGKVKLAMWLGTTAITLSIIALGYLVSHLSSLVNK